MKHPSKVTTHYFSFGNVIQIEQPGSETSKSKTV